MPPTSRRLNTHPDPSEVPSVLSQKFVAFERRCIHADGVAPPQNSGAIPCRRALPARRIATLGAERTSDSGH
jgi:hypothetical protein